MHRKARRKRLLGNNSQPPDIRVGHNAPSPFGMLSMAAAGTPRPLLRVGPTWAPTSMPTSSSRRKGPIGIPNATTFLSAAAPPLGIRRGNRQQKMRIVAFNPSTQKFNVHDKRQKRTFGGCMFIQMDHIQMPAPCLAANRWNFRRETNLAHTPPYTHKVKAKFAWRNKGNYKA